VALTGEGGLLTGLVRQVLQTGLEVELDDHLGNGRGLGQGDPSVPPICGRIASRHDVRLAATT
jgi:hypothetical protein